MFLWSYRLYPLMTCHSYFTFCILMKRQGHILQCPAIRTLFFVFYLNYRFIFFNAMSSVPYFLCFDEIPWSYNLVACHPYLTIYVLMKWKGSYSSIPCHRYLIFLCFTEIIGWYASFSCHPHLICCVFVKL